MRSDLLSPQSTQAALPIHPLLQVDLQTLSDMINMGRLGRLRDWAQSVGLRYPQHQQAMELVGELASNADLEALDKLHGRWVALGSLEDQNISQAEE
jgi:hypothetical protein